MFCFFVTLVVMPEPSFGSTTDQENDEINDTLSCNGATEDSLGADADVSDYNEPVDVTIDEGSDLIEYDFDADQIYDSSQAFVGTPQAEIFTPSYSFPVGAEVFLNLNPLFFNLTTTNFSDLYVAWFRDDFPMQGVVAGADFSTLEGLTVTGIGNPVPVCNSVSRLAALDTDADGLDDEWERRYFVDRNLAESIEAVLPDDDFDSDGALPINAVNTAGEFITVVPAVLGQDSLDGKYTNLEEYVWGTDPTSPDTDGDGHRDGDDILGTGQIHFLYMNEKEFGEEATVVRATAVGTAMQRTSNDERLIKIDSTTIDILTTNEENLDGHIILEDKYILPNESGVARFEPIGTGAQAKTLEINWYVDGDLQTAQSGFSQTVLDFKIPSDKTTGDYLVIAAAATNPTTGQISRISEVIRIGEPMVMSYLADQAFADEILPVTVNFLNPNARQDYVYKWFIDNTWQEDISGPGRNTLPLEITKQIEGDTMDVKVQVFEINSSEMVIELEEEIPVVAPSVDLILAPERPQAGSTVTVIADLTRFPGNSVEFDWTIDRFEVEQKQSSQISFTAGEIGAEHIVELGVQNDREHSDYAEAIAFIEIYPSSISSSSFLNSSFGKILARLNVSSPIPILTFCGIVLVIFISLLGIKKATNRPYNDA
ncbi:hypothetical protein ACFL1U_00540 [Patescibacteria group bacterium]